MRRKAVAIFVIIAATVFALFAAEIIIRIFLNQEISGSWRVYDPSGLIMNKSSGHSPHNHLEFSVDYEFGGVGFRIDEEQTVPKPEFHTVDKQRKVLIIGDSYTFGWLLP